MVNYDEQPTKYRSAPIEKQRTVSEGMQSQQNIGAKRSGKYKSYDGAYQTSSDSGSIDIRSYADSLQEELMKKIQENDCLKREVTALKSSMQGLEQRSNNITREMALKMNGGECFENVNDEFSNSNIARKFETLYNDDWVKLFRLLGKERQNLQELGRIKILSTLMKRSYDECKQIAERKLLQLLYLDENALLCPVEMQEMLKNVRKFWVKDSVRDIVKKNVLDIIFSTEEAKEFSEEESKTKVNEAMEDFYLKFIDCCWLIAVSHPPAILNFEVVGKQYEEIKEYFTEFAAKKPVQDLSKREQTIVLVVWPSVELKGESKYYKKGEVISVKIGKRFDESGDPHMNSRMIYTFSINHGQDEPYEVISFQNIDKNLPSTYV